MSFFSKRECLIVTEQDNLVALLSFEDISSLSPSLSDLFEIELCSISLQSSPYTEGVLAGGD